MLKKVVDLESLVPIISLKLMSHEFFFEILAKEIVAFVQELSKRIYICLVDHKPQ